MASKGTAPAGLGPVGLNRTRFYRELLTPLLHRRFTSAAGVVLLVCWIEAFAISEWSSFFWSWFPIGPAGIRTLLLFIAGLSVFILRIAQLHFGLTTGVSSFDTLRKKLLRLTTLQTLFIYTFSAFWFGEIYIWSAPRGADLGWIAAGKSWERQRLNERQIYLRCHFILLGISQTLYHVYSDLDRIQVSLPEPASKTGTAAASAPPTSTPLQKCVEKLAPLSLSTAKRALFFSFCDLFIYAILLRQTAWDWSLSIARVVFNVSRTSEPSLIPPYHYTLLLRSFTAGILLVGLWDFSNAIFSIYVAQEPLKKGKPLTDYAGDPNGVLLNGLKSKRQLVKNSAFQELYLISATFETRRQSIYSDLDREGGSAWSQILKTCLGVVEDINNRIVDKSVPPPEMTLKTKADSVPAGLPRLSAPLKEGTILSPSAKPQSRGERYTSSAGELAKYYGNSKADVSPLRTGLLAARDQLLTKEQQKALKSENVSQAMLDLLRRALRTPVGGPFRQLFRFRAREKVLGTPHSDLDNIVHAIAAVRFLAINSIAEDQFGTVNKDIALVLRTFVNITSSIEKFVRESPVHWTDVYFQSEDSEGARWGQGRHVEEIELILLHLRASLAHLISSFEGFAKDMGLGRVEIREARKAAGLLEPATTSSK